MEAATSAFLAQLNVLPITKCPVSTQINVCTLPKDDRTVVKCLQSGKLVGVILQ